MKQTTIRRSETHQIALPHIANKRYSSRVSTSRDTVLKSSFLSKMKQLAPQQQYGYMKDQLISEQQKKLKNLLRQFNHDSYDVMKHFMERSYQFRKKQERGKSSSLLEIKKKEISNSNDIIQICQKQIKTLQKKSENLKYLTVEQFYGRINQLKKQIQQITIQNKEINKENTLRGLSMVKDSQKISQVRNFQYEKHLLEHKKVKIEATLQNSQEQKKNIKDKQQNTDKQIEKNEQIYKRILEKQTQIQQNQKHMQQIRQKNKAKQSTINKKSSIASKQQHKYLQILKQLEEIVKEDKQTDLNISQANKIIQSSKKQIEELQMQLKNLKDPKTVITLKDVPKEVPSPKKK